MSRRIRNIIPGRPKNKASRQSINVSSSGNSSSSFIELESRNDESKCSTLSEASPVPSCQKSLPSDQFDMQMEIADLRERIKQLDSGNSKSELLDLLHEKDDELEKKNGQIRALTQKFHEVELGMGQIDQERKTSRQTIKSHTEEKNDLKLQLSLKERELRNREQEVQQLQARITSQEEKMKEVQNARSNIARIEQENRTLRRTIEGVNSEVMNIPNMQKSIRDLRSAKLSVENKLNDATSEYKSALKELRVTVSNQDNIIKKHEVREDKMNKHIATLREEKNGESIMLKRKMEEERKYYQEQLKALNLSFGKREVELDSKLYNERLKLREERDAVIENVREQSKRDKSYIMQKEAEIKQYENTVSDLKKSIANFESVSDRVAQLEKMCSEKESLIARLRADVKERDGMCDSMRDDVNHMELRIHELEEENSVIPDLETQLKNLMDSLSQLQEQNQAQKEEDESKIEALQSRLDNVLKQNKELSQEQHLQNEMENQLEAKLNDIEILIESKNKLISEKENDISSLNCKISEQANAHSQQVKKLRDDCEKANITIVNRQIELNELKDKLLNANAREENLKKELKEIESKFDSSEMQAAEIVNDLEEKLENAEAALATMTRKASDDKKHTDKIVHGMQAQLMGSLRDKENIESDSSDKITRLESYIDSLHDKHKLELSEKEKSIQTLQKKHSQKDNTCLLLCTQLDTYKISAAKHDSVVRELNNTITELKMEHSEEMAKRTADVSAYERKTSNAQTQKDIITTELNRVKADMEKTKKSLNEMMTQNKELSSELIEARMVASELQEEMDESVLKKSEEEKKIALKLQCAEEKLRRLINDVEKERRNRVDIETKLEAAKEFEDTMKQQAKEMTRMEAQILTLKDKISRQEAYLSRLLQKQKSTRTSGEGTRRAGNTEPSVITEAKTF